jgi:hypothetical protein
MASEHVLKIKAVLDSSQLKSEINSIKSQMTINGSAATNTVIPIQRPSQPAGTMNNSGAFMLGSSLGMLQSQMASFSRITGLSSKEVNGLQSHLTLANNKHREFVITLRASLWTFVTSKETMRAFASALTATNHILKKIGETATVTATSLELFSKAMLNAKALTIQGFEASAKKIEAEFLETNVKRENTRQTALQTAAETQNTSAKAANTSTQRIQTAETLKLNKLQNLTAVRSKLMAQGFNFASNSMQRLIINTKALAEVQNRAAQTAAAASVANGANSAMAFSGKFRGYAGALGFAALGASQILPTNNGAEKPTTGGAIGDVISSTAGMAMMGSIAGPWGAAIGGVIGFTTAIYKSTKAFDEYNKKLAEEAEARAKTVESYFSDVEMDRNRKTLVEKGDIAQLRKNVKNSRDGLANAEKNKDMEEHQRVTQKLARDEAALQQALRNKQEQAQKREQERKAKEVEREYWQSQLDAGRIDRMINNPNKENLSYLRDWRETAMSQRIENFQVNREEFEKYSSLVNTLDNAIKSIETSLSEQKNLEEMEEQRRNSYNVPKMDALSDLGRFGFSTARGEMRIFDQQLAYTKQIANGVNKLVGSGSAAVYV